MSLAFVVPTRVRGVAASAGAAVLAAILVACMGSESAPVQNPGDVHSTSHRIGEPSGNNIIHIAWSEQPDVQGYSTNFKPGPSYVPDTGIDLPGDATETISRSLPPRTWYFHLRTLGKNGEWTGTVHLGPFVVIGPDGIPLGTPGPTPPGASPTPTPAAP